LRIGTTIRASGKVSSSVSSRPGTPGSWRDGCGRAVQVELAPDAVGVEAHHPALLALRPAVDVVEIEIAHVGHLRDPEARGHRVEEDLVVLLVSKIPVGWMWRDGP
jgi:hypothetical protein